MPKQVSRYAWTMNRAEREAVLKLWQREVATDALTSVTKYTALRRRFKYNTMMGCWIGQLHGITLGIEEDGYTHS